MTFCKQKHKMLLRNVNTDLENSTESENANNHQLLSTILFESKYPLQRLEQNNKSTLTPIFSARYSPNNSKNIKNLDRRISYNDVYSLDRFGKNDMVEGGLSITMGSEFVYVDSRQKEIINFSFANVFRNSKDDNLPVTVEIRNTVNGYPGPKLVPFGRVIKETGDAKIVPYDYPEHFKKKYDAIQKQTDHHAHYPFKEANVKRFICFLRECGGFRVC